MKTLLTRLWKEDEGQDATEYAMLLFLITAALVASIKGLAGAINTVFTNITTTLT